MPKNQNMKMFTHGGYIMKMNMFKKLASGIFLTTALVTSSVATPPFNNTEYDKEESFSTKIQISQKAIEAIAQLLACPENSHQTEKLKGDISIWVERLEQNNKMVTLEKGQSWPIAENKGDIQRLPNDILLKEIFTKLPIKSILRAGEVNKEWHGVSLSAALWKNLGSHLSFLSSFPIPNEQLFIKGAISPSIILNVDVDTLMNTKPVNSSSSTVTTNHQLDAMTDENTQDTSLARAINEKLAEKGNASSISYKISGLSIGKHGYTQDLAAAHNFIETLVNQSNIVAISLKLDGLLHGWYGYTQDLAAAHDFIETLVNQSNIVAISLKLEGLEDGKYGYTQDLAATHNFIETLVKEGNTYAIQYKLEGLASGKYGYTQDAVAVQRYLSALEFLR